jgi:hypothetical protein
MNLINKEFITKKSKSDDILDEMIAKDFFAEVKALGFDMNILLYSGKYEMPIIDHFNNIIRKINEESELNVYEMILFINKEYSDIKNILNMLDENNKDRLRKELREIFYIKEDIIDLF